MSASAPSGRRSRRRGAISTSPAAIRRKQASITSTAAAGSMSAWTSLSVRYSGMACKSRNGTKSDRRLVLLDDGRLPGDSPGRTARPNLRGRARPGRWVGVCADGRVRSAPRGDGRRCSPGWDDAAGIAAQANAIGERAIDLAHTDGQAWEDALLALRDAEAATDDDPRRELRARAEARGGRLGAAGARVARCGRGRARRGGRRPLRRDLPCRRRCCGGARGRRLRGRCAPRARESRRPQVRSAPRACARERADGPRSRGSPPRDDAMTQLPALSDAELVRACRAGRP